MATTEDMPIFSQTQDERPLNELVEWLAAYTSNRPSDAEMYAMIASMKAEMRAEILRAHPWLQLED